jgi:hypothetical protein
MRAKGPAQSFQLLLDVAEALDKLKAPYAVSFHGMPRATDDADAMVWLAGTGLSSDDLLKNLRQAGFHADPRTGDMDDPISAVLVVKDSFENEVDLILGIRGMDPAARSRSVLTTYQDTSIRIIGARSSRADLRIWKTREEFSASRETNSTSRYSAIWPGVSGAPKSEPSKASSRKPAGLRFPATGSRWASA